MIMEILEIARREYDEAKEFYETEQPGLGSQFEEQIRLKHGRRNARKFGDTSSTNSHIRFSIPFKMTK